MQFTPSQLIDLRAAVLAQIRTHFAAPDYRATEVQTSSLQHYPSYLPACYRFNDNAANPDNPDLRVLMHGQPARLAPFHEFELRALCVRHNVDVYQIAPCFRNEQDTTHLYCFHMVEWAQRLDQTRTDVDYQNETLTLIEHAFEQAGMSVPPPATLSWRQEVPARGYVLLQDFLELDVYPSPHCVDGVQQRFELFYDGIEIANVFLDNCDADDFTRKWPEAPDAIVEMVRDAPPTICAAIGLERLLMAMTGERDVHNTLPCP